MTRHALLLALAVAAAAPASADPLSAAEVVRRFDRGDALMTACHERAVRTKVVNTAECMDASKWVERELPGLKPALEREMSADPGLANRYQDFVTRLEDVVRLSQVGDAYQQLMDQARQHAASADQ